MKNKHILIPLMLLNVTFFIGSFLMSSYVSADDSVVDNVAVTVPASCTISGTGMTSHNATIPNGTYQADIGTTTLKALCNDTDGFAIFATGYKGNTIGETNSNKLVGTTNPSTTISTGTATSGNTSNWAMKLATSSGATYPLTLDNGFGSYSSVPNSYTKVAHRDSATDVGTNATGSTLTTTYAAYMNQTQAADTYSGQVIYTLVHPSSADAPVVCNPSATTITQVRCMQDFAGGNVNSIVASMAIEQQYTLKDKRDNKSYTVAKMADGNVWMTKNLDLDLDSNITYTNMDTDLGYNSSTGLYETATWRPERSTYGPTSTHTVSQWPQTINWAHPQSYDPGNLYWNGGQSDYSDWEAYGCLGGWEECNQSLNPIPTYTLSVGTMQQHLGNYYNWAAAMAMNDSSEYDWNYSNTIVEQSICPTGWTLPRAGVNYYPYTDLYNEDTFKALWNIYDVYGEGNNYEFENEILTSSPLYYSRSGLFNAGGYLDQVGYSGMYWSAVVGDWSVGFGPTSMNLGYYTTDRNFGLSIRCIARPVVAD